LQELRRSGAALFSQTRIAPELLISCYVTACSFVIFLMGAPTVSVVGRWVVVWSVVDAAVQKPFTAEFAEHAEPNGLYLTLFQLSLLAGAQEIRRSSFSQPE
jgi:hypothetical protein